jgi:hypothetical protein
VFRDDHEHKSGSSETQIKNKYVTFMPELERALIAPKIMILFESELTSNTEGKQDYSKNHE